MSDAEEKLRRQVEELKTLATKVVGLTAEKDNLSSRHESTTGDLAPNHTHSVLRTIN